MLKRKSNTYCLYIVYEMVAKNKTENYQTFRKHRNFSHTLTLDILRILKLEATII